MFKSDIRLTIDQCVSIRMTANRIRYLAADIQNILEDEEDNKLLANEFILKLRLQVIRLLEEFEDE